MTVDEMRSKLNYATAMLERANAAKTAANALSEQAHEMGGGIPGFGGSGSQRAASQVRSAHERAHRAHNEADERIALWHHKVKSLQRRIAEAERVRFTAADLKAAKFVRAGGSWREVVRVSAKSVTVTTGYSWTDRIQIDQITDYHPRQEKTA